MGHRARRPHGDYSHSCMGLAIQSTLEKGIGSTTLEFKISLVRAITPETGQITAEGKVLNCGRRVGTAEGRITDTKGRLLAHGTTTCLIFPSQRCRTHFRRRCRRRGQSASLSRCQRNVGSHSESGRKVYIAALRVWANLRIIH